MADDPRKKWAVFSGLTRREQQVLVFLIVVAAAGLAYNQYTGGWRAEPLVLHRGSLDKSAPAQPRNAVPAADRPSSPRLPDSPTSAAPQPAGGASPAVPGDPAAELLDLNRATLEQLDSLPGIGAVRARDIVRYRETHGPFRRLEDLQQVSGIGPKTFARIRPLLQPISPATTGPPPGATPPTWPTPAFPGKAATQPLPGLINLNTATEEELDSLDGIGTVLARRIIEHRVRYGPFRTPAELQKVEGIGRAVFERNRARLTVGRPI